MKIVFVNCVFHETKMMSYPIGLVSLGTILKKAGHNVEIVDFTALFHDGLISKEEFHRIDVDVFVNYIKVLDPDVVSFLTTMCYTHIQIAMAKRLKEWKPSVKIIFAGPHASSCAREFLEIFPFIDIIAMGEGELIVEDLMIGISQDKDISWISGIASRDSKGNIIVNSGPPLLRDLNQLPIADLELFPAVYHHKFFHIEAGRGCPHQCTYCSTSAFWKRKYRLKSISRILSEIDTFKTLHGFKDFYFMHDSLSTDPSQLKELCKGIIDHQFNIQWGMMGRIDNLDEENIRLLKESGCIDITIGIESGSPRIQEEIKKRLNFDETEKNLRLLNQYKIPVALTFIYNFPDETEEDLRATLKMIDRYLRTDGLSECGIGNLLYNSGAEITEKNLHRLKFNQELMSQLYDEEYVEMFRNSPKIFSHMWYLEENKYPMFELFVNQVLCPIYFGNSEHYKKILSSFNNDPFRMYYRLREIGILDQLNKDELITASTPESFKRMIALITNIWPL